MVPLYPFKLGETARSFEWVPDALSQLMDADYLGKVEPEFGFYAMLLWTRSLRANPAGTLPVDPQALMKLCRFKGNGVRWRKHSIQILHGWERVRVLGKGPERERLAHPVVTDMVRRLMALDADQRVRRQDWLTGRVRNVLREILQRMAAPRSLLLDDEVFADCLARVRAEFPRLVVDEVHAGSIATRMMEAYAESGLGIKEWDDA